MEVKNEFNNSSIPLNNNKSIKKGIINVIYQKENTGINKDKETNNNIFSEKTNLQLNSSENVDQSFKIINEVKHNENLKLIEKDTNTIKKSSNPYFDFFPTEIRDLNEKESKTYIIGNKNKKIKIMTKSEILENRFKRKDWKLYRKVNGKIWKDETLKDWKEEDYRIWVGNLGNEVKDGDLALAFSKYGSLLKARVVIDKRLNKSKGYGFVSFEKAEDYAKAMKEMNNCHIGNRPIKLQRGKWKNRSVKFSKSKIPTIKIVKKKDKNLLLMNN